MTTTEPDVIPTGRYSITETASLLGLSPRTIQRKVETGLLTAKYRKGNKRPFITGIQITKYWNKTI